MGGRRRWNPDLKAAVERWHDLIGDPTLADAILDRLVHNAHRIQPRGESLRKKKPVQAIAA